MPNTNAAVGTIPKPATLAELITAIEGYRLQLSNFAHITSYNLVDLERQLQARLDAVKP